MDSSSSAESVKPFISKLHAMVSDPANANTLAWVADGAAISIVDLEPFCSTLLPKYFKHGNLSSFVRQLNTYGFSKLDGSTHVFQQKDFHRDHPERLALIVRRGAGEPPLPKRAAPSAGASAGAAEEDQLVLRSTGGAAALPMPDGLAGAAASSAGAALAEPGAAALGEQMSSMSARILQLSEEVKAAKARQADTRASIGSIMQLLSQVYHDHHRQGGEFAGMGGDDAAHGAKRRRLEGGGAPGLAWPPNPSPPTLREVPSESQLAGAAAAAAGAVQPFAGGSSFGEPALTRTPSLGAAVALALPHELREIAMDLAGSTELQDQCVEEVRGGGRQIERQASSSSALAEPSADDLDAFLWDFIEKNTEIADEHDGGGA